MNYSELILNKTTNISTHQLTEIELATWNPDFFVDLLVAEWRHLYSNSNPGVFNFQILPTYTSKKTSCLNTVFFTFKLSPWTHWSPRSAEIVYIKSCILCWVPAVTVHPILDLSISTCSSYKLLFSQSKSKQQTSSNKPGARLFPLHSSNYQKTVPWRHYLKKFLRVQERKKTPCKVAALLFH